MVEFFFHNDVLDTKEQSVRDKKLLSAFINNAENVSQRAV